jgi:hypothetical protein
LTINRAEQELLQWGSESWTTRPPRQNDHRGQRSPAASEPRTSEHRPPPVLAWAHAYGHHAPHPCLRPPCPSPVGPPAGRFTPATRVPRHLRCHCARRVPLRASSAAGWSAPSARPSHKPPSGSMACPRLPFYHGPRALMRAASRPPTALPSRATLRHWAPPHACVRPCHAPTLQASRTLPQRYLEYANPPSSMAKADRARLFAQGRTRSCTIRRLRRQLPDRAPQVRSSGEREREREGEGGRRALAPPQSGSLTVLAGSVSEFW